MISSFTLLPSSNQQNQSLLFEFQEHLGSTGMYCLIICENRTEIWNIYGVGLFFFSFFFFHHNQSLCIWFLDLVIHWMWLAIWTDTNSHTHALTQTQMNPDTVEQLVFLHLQKRKDILPSAYFVWFFYASIHQSILACSNRPGQYFSSSEETFWTESLVILFLHTWNDLKWMQRFKNQNKFKPFHCAGIQTPLPANHFLEIHSFKGEGCLPLNVCQPETTNRDATMDMLLVQVCVIGL